MVSDAKSVLIVGLVPELADLSGFPGLTPEKIRAGIGAQVEKIRAAGYAADHLWIDRGETAESVLRAKLAEKRFDAVCIGAGVRVPPPMFMLFERVLNVVHEGAPQARICFNSNPGDTLEAVQRWV